MNLPPPHRHFSGPHCLLSYILITGPNEIAPFIISLLSGILLFFLLFCFKKRGRKACLYFCCFIYTFANG
jgi:hypothetical protein